MSSHPINLFYEEPNPDRWIKYDRYPRQIIRSLVRRKPRPGGVMMIALELMKGLDLLKMPYRFNDYKYARKHPNELICIIGKPHLIFEKRFKNPILFGAGTFSHPIECPDFFTKYPNVKKMLVPGPWMEKMCKPYYGDQVCAWPVGIDSEKWSPEIKQQHKSIDFLIYDKFALANQINNEQFLLPILKILDSYNLNYKIIRYGSYTHDDLINDLAIAKAAIFLSNHETQGIAYQQILATGTPILAWDEGGYWKDPSFYPELVKYKSVSSVPYWDDTCGVKFKDLSNFKSSLDLFLSKIETFSPRSYILKNLTLEISAQAYINIVQAVNENITNR
ncbi:glycosyltransferase [Pedobacter nototheniae]|uniref:glycosyltransferase n=1 Tax=Pedobacter nototheniae TaxID=2488994 RepID=UPI00292D1E62|nr:glycosyltransferase [Pedobacter nototheniae]